MVEVVLCVSVVVLSIGYLVLRSMLKELEGKVAARFLSLEQKGSALAMQVSLHICQQSLPHGLGDRFSAVWKAIDAKADKPLLRRSTDKPNRRRGDKK